MLIYPILAARSCSLVDKTFLSTDDLDMARMGRHHGASVIDRPETLRSAETPLEAILEHGHLEILRRCGAEPAALVVLLANAPTVTPGLIEQGIEILLSNDGLDAVMSVSLHNAYRPAYALRYSQNGLVRPMVRSPEQQEEDTYFPDSLLWVLRPVRFFASAAPPIRPNWIVNAAEQQIAPLIHEGYGDVDYPWQIPAIEEWLRRRGFTETQVPYAVASAVLPSGPVRGVSQLGAERRVLVTTVPFGQKDPRPLELLEGAGVDYALNPLGRRLREEELIRFGSGFGILIAGTEPITAAVMDAAPHLRLIARVGIGFDNVDLEAARRRGIHVTYTPDAPSAAVAELTIGLMLALLRDISGADRLLRNGIWRRHLGRRLAGLTVGVVGVGRIGKRVIRHLRGGFPEVHILGNDIAPDQAFGGAFGVDWVEKPELYSRSDIITLHVPLDATTHHLIGSAEIGQMKPTALLVNTARGAVVNERDLVAALRSGLLGGAALDVYESEPYSGELVTVERCVLTCHMGSMSEDSRARMELEATEEALRFLRGQPLLCPVPAAVGAEARPAP